jgi:uncharacterized membrane protein YhaH (DUF805 family)
MGVFSEFFGFDGRINRLGYLWRSLVVTVGLALLAGAGAGALFSLVRPLGQGGFDAWMQRLVLVTLLLALWSSFAIASRRLRDMGFEPIHIVPLYAALWVVNTVLLQPLAQLRPDDFSLLEGGWAALQLLAAVPLLFWPTRTRANAPAPVYTPTEPTAYLNWREGG